MEYYNEEQYRPTGFRLLPPVVKNILIISILFYLATYGLNNAFGIDLIDTLGMHYFAAEKFKPYQLVTYMFLHGSFQHIFFNMFAFWMFGYVLENTWGSKRFLIFFLVTGMGAAMIQMLVFYFQLSPDISTINSFMSQPNINDFYTLFGPEHASRIGLDTLQYKLHHLNLYQHELAEKITYLQDQAKYFPSLAENLRAQANALQTEHTEIIQQADSIRSVALSRCVDFAKEFKTEFLNKPIVIGASGAVFGILLAFGMMFPNTRIYIYFLFPMKAKWFVILYGVIELIAGFKSFIGNFGDNIAHFAHLGGMLFGFILIMLWRKRRKKFDFE